MSPTVPPLRDIEKKFKATKDLRIARILVEPIWADWAPPFSDKLLPEKSTVLLQQLHREVMLHSIRRELNIEA
jgi:hypothetical protein